MNLNRGRYTDALKSFENARRELDNSYVYSGIGRAYYGLGKYSDALKNFEIACMRYSGNIQATHWMAKTLGKMKRYNEAETLFNVVLRRLGNGPVNFYQEVFADYEDMKNERAGIKPRDSFSQPLMSYSLNKDSSTKIIFNGDISAPVNIGGVQATDNAILNRPVIMREPGTGCNVPIEQIIQRSEERNTVDIKPTGILSRIIKKETCANCGAPTQEDQHYCNKCGRKLQ
ncbi:MAG: hypothetical protein RBR05_02430 [Candidatus Methanomethylophilaceae archaeon]|nr:hypothetical protein [Candidatus Methanomethylophilaceae archaeon]MDY0224242.1 hypothetical protein [Candidatus Methanomethylophilaceae archaeon]